MVAPEGGVLPAPLPSHSRPWRGTETRACVSRPCSQLPIQPALDASTRALQVTAWFIPEGGTQEEPIHALESRHGFCLARDFQKAGIQGVVQMGGSVSCLSGSSPLGGRTWLQEASTRPSEAGCDLQTSSRFTAVTGLP